MLQGSFDDKFKSTAKQLTSFWLTGEVIKQKTLMEAVRYIILRNI